MDQVIDDGSRPASVQAARTRSNCVAVVSASAKGRLNSVAYRAASAGVRFLPPPPMTMGTESCTGFGRPGDPVTEKWCPW